MGLVTPVWSSYCCGDSDVLRPLGGCGTIALSKKLPSRHLSHIKGRHNKVLAQTQRKQTYPLKPLATASATSRAIASV
jgi:hypothetical protein